MQNSKPFVTKAIGGDGNVARYLFGGERQQFFG